MKNIALGQEEVYSCAFWLLTMISLRNPWDKRQQARRAQFRFRRDPGAYLTTFEDKLLLLRLPP